MMGFAQPIEGAGVRKWLGGEASTVVRLPNVGNSDPEGSSKRKATRGQAPSSGTEVGAPSTTPWTKPLFGQSCVSPPIWPKAVRGGYKWA